MFCFGLGVGSNGFHLHLFKFLFLFAEQYCTFCVHFSDCVYLTAQLSGIHINFSFTISAPVNEKMSDWFICAQMLQME